MKKIDFKNKEQFRLLERNAYYGVLDISDFPAAEYKYFDTIASIGYKFRHEGLPKEFCVERKEAAYKTYIADVELRESRQRYWKWHQDNIIRAGDIRSRIQKAESLEEKLKLSLECIQIITGEQGFAERNLK